MKKEQKKRIDIPPGKAKPRSSFPEHLEKGPPMKYKQGVNKNTCLVYSFASALHHIGAKLAAFVLIRKSAKIIDHCDTVKRFSIAVKDSDPHMYFEKLKVSAWNILEVVDNQLVVASVVGSDGKEEHCVTVYNKWVFDSNFDFALPLSKESLDLCCSAEDTQDSFVCVKEARLCRYANVLDSKKKPQAQLVRKKRGKK